MHLTLFMAVSANGKIARPNGSEDFLSNDHWTRFVALAKEHGNVIMGRKTYAEVKTWNEDIGLHDIADVEKIIVTTQAPAPEKNVTPVSSPTAALDHLAQKGVKRALLAGGATTNTAFANAGLINEILLSVEPVFIGEGLNLFADNIQDLHAELTEATQHGPYALLRYMVKNV